MRNIIFGVIAFILLIAVVVVGLLVTLVGVRFASQTIEKRAFGEYEYRISDRDMRWYATHEYIIDENDCVGFIDNYGQRQKFCEKYNVSEYYLHSHSPSLESVFFGY